MDFKAHQSTIDGYQVYIGKDALSNDYLTLKFAQANDYWFHIKGCPGSHVILKCHDEEKPETNTIKKVASLAAYYSQQKKAKKVKVIYTHAKNVKKYKGAAAGSVISNKEKTVQVHPLSLEDLEDQ